MDTLLLRAELLFSGDFYYLGIYSWQRMVIRIVNFQYVNDAPFKIVIYGFCSFVVL